MNKAKLKKCRLCGCLSDSKIIKVNDYIRDTGIVYDYFECKFCNSLNLLSSLSELKNIYNKEYPSFAEKESHYIIRFIRRIRNFLIFRGQSYWIFKFLSYLKPLPIDFSILGLYLDKDDRILDVGCGKGALINDLKDVGFKNVLGIDPFAEKDYIYNNGVKVLKKYPYELKQSFDIVISHNSLEHDPNPLKTLKSIYKLLNKKGYLILTVPIAENLYRNYRENCCLIQAPQHYFLPSIDGLNCLLSKTAFSLESILRLPNHLLSDNILSKLLEKNIYPKRYKQNIYKLGKIFIGKEFLKSERIRCYNQKSKKLGDHATLILRK